MPHTAHLPIFLSAKEVTNLGECKFLFWSYQRKSSQNSYPRKAVYSFDEKSCLGCTKFSKKRQNLYYHCNPGDVIYNCNTHHWGGTEKVYLSLQLVGPSNYCRKCTALSLCLYCSWSNKLHRYDSQLPLVSA